MTKVRNALDVKKTPKAWGFEEQFYNENYGLKALCLTEKNVACSIHFHAVKTETFYVLAGAVTLEIYEIRMRVCGAQWFEAEDLRSGGLKYFCKPKRHILRCDDFVTLLPGTAHRFWSPFGNGHILEASSYDDPADSYRIVPAGPAPKGFQLR